ncbi:MAG TPA: transglutaminaseTgpA domain-containing protein [Symbiobacteriaceae bacterium]|nr:transglutaminaseTgpA domain-containing protein [Symbiobacteriaceae bacterium]
MRRQLAPSAQLMQVGSIALTVYILLVGTGAFWRVEPGTGWLLLVAVIAAGFGWLAWRQGWVALLLVLLPPALLPLLVKVPHAPAWLVEYHQTLQQQIVAFIMDLGVEGPAAGFGLTLGKLFLVAIGLCVGAVAGREALGRGRAFITFLVGSAIFGSQWAFFWEPAASYGAAFAAVALLLWILAGSGQRQAMWAESGRKVQYQSPLTAPLAGVLIVALGARILPADFLPSTASLFASITESIPFLEQLRGNKGGDTEFGLLSTGFSPNGSTLGGPVQANNTPALEVRLPGTLDETLYLRGAVYERFTGSRWQQAEVAHVGFSTVSAVPTYLHPDAFRREEKVEIKQLQTFGRSLFSPAEAYKIDGLAWEVDGAQMLRGAKAVKRNASYTVSVNLPDWSAEQIRLFEREALGLPPGSPLGSATNLVAPVPSPGVDPLGKSYNTAAYLPAGATQAIIDYTNQIFERGDFQTPYEKAVALESWLRSAFPYDLNAPAPRPGQNFVQFFLFESQRGYCTYFASAMTLMLQVSGVQARLVEGFVLPASTTLTRGADGTAAYVVTNAMAHAWVEAWIPGYGWVTFDPTPRGDVPLADRSRPLVAPTVPTGTDNTPGADPTDSGNDPRVGPRNQQDEGDLGFGTGTAGAQGPNWPLVGFLAALISLIGFALLRLRLQAPRFSLPGRSGVTETWSKSEGLLHRFGWGRKAAQTPREWADHVGERVRDLQEPLKSAAADYTLARWGPPSSSLDPAAPARATALWRLVTEAMRYRYGTLSYLWRRLTRAPRRK